MKLGTKSLLFGCHQFILHPIFVIIAWIKLYGWRTLTRKVLIAIIVHDWGYWGCKTMDGPDGKWHSYHAALWFADHLAIADMVLLHSRHTAKELGCDPSSLCWADKLSLKLMGGWLWAILAHISGEGYEYMNNRYGQDYPPGCEPNVRGLKKFYDRFAPYLVQMVKENQWKTANAVYFQKPAIR